MCSLAKENNPMRKFMIGNLKTLQHPDTREVNHTIKKLASLTISFEILFI